MLNMDDFLNKFNESFIQKYPIREATKEPPTQTDKNYIWTFESLVQVIRSHSLAQDFYGVKNRDLFSEALFLLNEGYLNFKISDFDFDELGFSGEEIREALNHEQHAFDMYKHIRYTFKYSDDIDMAFAIWKEHFDKGERDIKFSNKNISVFIENAKIAYKFRDAPIKIFLRAFEQGIKEFNIILYSRNNVRKMYTFSPTLKYSEYHNENIARNKELKKNFNQIKGKYNAQLDTYNNENLSEGNLVEFIYEGETIRGYVYKKSNEFKDYDTLQMEINAPIQQLHHDFLTIQGMRKTCCILFFDEAQFSQSEYIIKSLKLTTRMESHNFYAVNREQIVCTLNIDVSDTIIEMIKKSKAVDSTLDFKISHDGDKSEDTINSNACYYPDTHRIKIFLYTLFNTVAADFTLDRIHPNDLTACIIAHEIGHSDFEGREILNEEYAKNVDTINELGILLTNSIDSIELSKTPSLELVKETLDLASERVTALQKHYNIVMQSEMNAFLYGLKYLDNDNLKRLAQQNNYKTYTSYLKSELIPLRNAQVQYYMLKRFLDILCKE